MVDTTNPLFVVDTNDPGQILKDADAFFTAWFSGSDDSDVATIQTAFDAETIDLWWLGARTSGLVQIYDLVAPLDPDNRGAQYMERLRRINHALLDNRDDHRKTQHVDPFRERVMAAWGAFTADRDGQWNTDPVTAGLCMYTMAAFARRVADHPLRYAASKADAIRFIVAVMETYQAFRPELHLVEGDPEAYYTVPWRYANLHCDGNSSCENYRAQAGQAIAYNENLSMMKALAEVALAADSALFHGSSEATPEQLQRATQEVPLLVAKNVAFFVNHLRANELPDRTPYFQWDTQLPLKPVAEDISHGGSEIDYLTAILDNQVRLNALLARAGRTERLALGAPLFTPLANTFLRKIWRSDNTLCSSVTGNGDATKEGCGGWIPLAQFDPWVWIRARDATFSDARNKLRPGSHAALIRYRKFRAMKYLTEFAGQNWLITPAALAVGEAGPATIHDQQWLIVLSGVVLANLKGDSSAQWEDQTVSFIPDMAGPDDPSATSGPLNWAISRYAIPRPPGSAGRDYVVRLSVDELAPAASLGSIFNQGQSIDSGFAVNAWRPNAYGHGTDVVHKRPVGNLFSGVNVDLSVRDSDAWLYRLSYSITLLGKIVFVAPAF